MSHAVAAELESLREDFGRVLASIEERIDRHIEFLDNAAAIVPARIDGTPEPPAAVAAIKGRFWFGTGQAADYSSKNVQMVRKALEAGELCGSHTGPGGRWTVHRDFLDAWCAGQPCTREHLPTEEPAR